jgi:O-antigen/teichoic acid export membrane protein
MSKGDGRGGWIACLVAEMVAGLLGFAATAHLARRLEPRGFATLEVALAASGWLLVLVRGGLDQVVIREAARHPRLIGRLSWLLIGLRLLWAVVGLSILSAIALASGPNHGAVVLAGGLILVASALVMDVGPRARSELGFLAGLQVIRGVGLITAVVCLVGGPESLTNAAMAPAFAESLVAAACLAWSWRHGESRSVRSGRYPKRVAIVLSRRAAIAGLTRFLRVGLYAADALALGLVADSVRGEYAAGRRVVFALVAVGLVLPSILQPALARARDGMAVSREIGRGLNLLFALFIPAAVGLIAIADRGMPILFGPEYAGGFLVVALTAIRLPILLVATLFQSALVARGEETRSLQLMITVSLVAIFLLPTSGLAFGVTGIGVAILMVETIGVVGGWMMLRALGISPGRGVEAWPIATGCLAMVATVAFTRIAPLPVGIVLGATAYGVGWLGCHWAASRLSTTDRLDCFGLEGPSR